MRLWGDKSGPCMQLLHAAFAIGAFTAPLIAKPFIQDIADTEDDYNTSLVFNVSCSNENFTETMFCDDIDSLGCACIDAITEACNTTSDDVVDIYYDMYGNASNCTVITQTDEHFASQFGWAYWISAMCLVPPLPAFVYFAIRYNIANYWKERLKVSQGENHLEFAENVDDQDTFGDSKDNCNTVSDRETSTTTFTLKTYKIPAFVILFCFMFSYVGSEVSYGSLVFTYAVKGKLQFNKQTAATLTAVFWGPFAFARLFSIILALLKVRASVMMTMNVSGSVIAILILIVLPHNNIAIWITSCLLGASFASIFPTTMTWLSEHLPVSGKATAVVVAGGNLGDILIPSAIAALIGNVSPDSFVYSIFTFVVLSTVLVALLFAVTFIYQRRHKLQEVKSVRYHKLEEIVDIGTESAQNGDLSPELSEFEPEKLEST